MYPSLTKSLAAAGLGVLILAMAVSARAELLAYEGFDYTLDADFTAAAAGLNGGTGWSASDTWLNDTDAKIGPTLTMANLLLPSTGGSMTDKLDNTGGLSTVRDLANPSAIDFGVDANYYFSYLLRRNGNSTSTSSEWANAGLAANEAGDNLIAVGGSTSDEGFRTEKLGTNSATYGSGTFLDGQTYLIVVKVEAHAVGDDQIFMQVYGESDVIGAEPTTEWTVVGGTEDTTDIGIAFRISGGGNVQADFDEIRIGTTWADVTGFAGFHPGDANGDGMVNLADLQILGDNWQSTTATWAEADFSGDGNVNLADLQVIGDNWGFGTGSDVTFEAALGEVAIPEPATMMLLGGLVCSNMLRRGVNR